MTTERPGRRLGWTTLPLVAMLGCAKPAPEPRVNPAATSDHPSEEATARRVHPFRDLQWQKRPLVIVSPIPEDRRLAEMRAAFEAERATAEERQMVLIVLFHDGSGTIDGTPLDEQSAAELGFLYGSNSEPFVIRLVGKDARVKRSEPLPIPMAELFEQIDAMPMRQAEMRRGR